jgi:sorbitol/mannitol transport system substrate-binding protein
VACAGADFPLGLGVLSGLTHIKRGMPVVLKCMAALLICMVLLQAQGAELVVATVNNGHMMTMQRLAGHFERSHPGVRIRWVTLEEGALRQQVTRDIVTRGGRFDVLTLGVLEAPLWGKQGWLTPIAVDAAYDADDLLPGVRQALSAEGKLFAAPFYGESSMTMARADLLKAKGLTLPERPTWAQIRSLAAKLHDPARGVYGICLRGKAGWGENMTLITPMVNAHGGQWFDMRWQPQLTSAPWQEAVSLYVELLRQWGPPGATANGYNENLALFSEGRCALWVDATVAGSFLSQARYSKVAGQVQFAQAPSALTSKGSHWLWSWALAIPTSSRQTPLAQAFVKWATSKAYIRLVAQEEGWAAVPSGTRKSTYAEPAFMAANPWAVVERDALGSANPMDATVPKSPYVGIQFATIPEFQAIGTAVGQQISTLLTNTSPVAPTLARAQKAAERKMQEAGYLH